MSRRSATTVRSSFTPFSRAISGIIFATREPQQRGLQGQSGRAAAVRADGRQLVRHRADSAAAALAAGHPVAETERRDCVLVVFHLCLGAGYILIQVALIQKFVLLLGHPTYALTVIVFSMLVSSGAGQLSSAAAWLRMTIARLARAAGAIAVLVAALAFGARPLTQAAAGMAAAGEDADHRAGHRAGRVPDGNALPQRPPPAGAEAIRRRCAGPGR